jgi:predicted DNA-binding transcriptional regulator AlpA
MPTLLGEEWLEPADLAAGLKVDLRTVYRWNATGSGPVFVRCGKHVRYARSSVERWIADGGTSRREPVEAA